jgi:hypothetical protein
MSKLLKRRNAKTAETVETAETAETSITKFLHSFGINGINILIEFRVVSARHTPKEKNKKER